MRIGIDYQILALGPELITRGMGRYTQQQLREVLAVDRDNEYLLLCEAGADLSLIDPAVLEAPNVDLACYPKPRAEVTEATTLQLAEHYLAWLERQGLDLYHATAPLMLTGPPLVRVDTCPTVVTLYDLIPLRYPDRYYVEDPLRRQYERGLGFLATADRLLAISEYARSDAVALIGYPEERIDKAWPIADDVFRPLPDHLVRKLLSVVSSRIRIPEHYLLTVSHIHYSKNLDTLLRAYAGLPEALRTRLPLVLCCHLDQASLNAVGSLAFDLGISADLVITGGVSDAELAALYNRATLVVHPSRAEGFGFPVLEAMRCGAPVVTTTASSLPEVAGDAALQVDPEDAGSLAAAIQRVAGDPALQATLRAKGFVQAERFNRHQLAEATLACYQRAVALPPAPGGPGPAGRRIALWTPLPPQATGIADYSAELLDGLATRCEVDVFVDGGYLPAGAVLQRHHIHHASGFVRRNAARPYDAVLYQVGASPFHAYMTAAFEAHPGIAVLHDLIWSNVVYTEIVHETGDAPRFHRMLADLHGARAVEELRRLAFEDQDAVWDFFGRYPMLDPVVNPSIAQIVHFPDAARELLAAFPGSHPWVVPMGVADPYAGQPDLDQAAARTALGMDPERFVASLVGLVHPLKRVESCLWAIAALKEQGRHPLLVVAGPCYDQAYLERLSHLGYTLGLGDTLEFTGRLPREDFDRHMVAADVIVNLRAPVHKHMSAVLMRSVAAGKPVVLSDLPEWRFLPGSFCWRVPVAGEAEAVATALGALEDDPGRRRAMGEAARAWYLAEGTAERMAERYLGVVDAVIGGRGQPPPAHRGAPQTDRYNSPVPGPLTPSSA
ncbi:MAG TPA: glycosyltransferase [Actinomycetota bacterium]|nr:glycosyltransferase [Actinomycetota bacterium]